MQVQSSIVVLTNNSYTSIVQLPILFNLKIELSEGTILLLLDLDNDVYHVVDVFDTSHFLFRKAEIPTLPSLLPTNIDNIHHSLPLMKLLLHGSSSLRLPLHHFSSS